MRRYAEQSPYFVEIACALTIGKETVMPNAVETGWQDVDEEATDELRRIEGT